MINRREFLGITAGAGAALALTPELLRAFEQSGGKLMQRAIPSSGEMLPVISFAPRSLGGAAMSSQPADVAAIKAVLKTFLDNGGKVVDVLHGGPAGEQSARAAAAELGIQNKFFSTTPHWSAPCARRPAEGRPRRTEGGDGREVHDVQDEQDRSGHGEFRRRHADLPRRPEGVEEARARPLHRRASPRLPTGRLDARVRPARIGHTERAGRFRRHRLLRGRSPRRGNDPAARPGAEDCLHVVFLLRSRPHLQAHRDDPPSGVGGGVRREDLGAVLSQICSRATRPWW